MTTLKIRGGKLQFVRSTDAPFCFPFCFSSDPNGIYTIRGLNNEFQFEEHIDTFLDESLNPAWAGQPDSLDEFLAQYSSIPVDTNSSDAIASLDDTIRGMFVLAGLIQSYYWQGNVLDVKQISSGKASLLGFRFQNNSTTAKTFRFYDIATTPVPAMTPPAFQIVVEPGKSANHYFNGHLIQYFGSKMFFTVHNDDQQATNTYTPSGTGFTVHIDWKQN